VLQTSKNQCINNKGKNLYYEGVCMKGGLYTLEKCPVCGSGLKHDENKDGFFCAERCQKVIPRKIRVKFGRQVSKMFNNHNYLAARQYLEGLRFKTVEGTFDHRDYLSDNPLGFQTQAEKWLVHKKSVSASHYRNIKRDIEKAVKVWGQTNVKAIGYGEIQDFLDGLELSSKSKSEVRSTLHSFFTWLCLREKNISMPDMPVIKFECGWRNIVSLDTQQAILNEVRRISWDTNPKIWLGIKWLATYIAFRPNELRNLKESEINISGFFVVPKPKEKTPKLIAMLPEDIELYNEYRGIPNLYFFRHVKGNGNAKPGTQFGKDYLYKWWKKACSNLGIEGVDLYGGTRHSTATSLSEHFSETDIMQAGTIHKSNKAARRYIQAQKNASLQIYQKAAEMQKSSADIVPFKKVKK
jgi:predicted nucleic acid-binding Zn ribbon protein